MVFSIANSQVSSLKLSCLFKETLTKFFDFVKQFKNKKIIIAIKSSVKKTINLCRGQPIKI